MNTESELSSDRRVTLHYDAALLEQVVRRFWLRAVGPWTAMAASLVGVPFAVAYTRGDRSWILGALGAATALVLLLSASIYLTHRRQTLERLRKLRNEDPVLEFGERGLRFESAAGSSRLTWNEVTELWQYPRYWLLLLAPNQFITLPLRDFDEDLRREFESRTRAAGARIRTAA